MRTLWDEAEAKSRAAVLADGVQINDVNEQAFRAAAAPFVRGWLRDPADVELLPRDPGAWHERSDRDRRPVA